MKNFNEYNTEKILLMETEPELREAYNKKVAECLKLKKENYNMKTALKKLKACKGKIEVLTPPTHEPELLRITVFMETKQYKNLKKLLEDVELEIW